MLFLAGCSDDPGLQERLNRLQAEMQEKDRQLLEAQSTVEKTKSELKAARASNVSKPSPMPGLAPQFLPREQVEANYAAASDAMQKRLATELHNYSVENCAQFPVMMPSDEYPYHSKVALTFRADSGRSSRLEFPVSADATGKWTFPNSVDIASALAETRPPDQTGSTASGGSTPAGAAQTNATPPPNSRNSPANNPGLIPGQSATETRVIDWGGDRSSNNNRPLPSPSLQSTPTPQGGKSPTQTMPSNQDVTIHWK